VRKLGLIVSCLLLAIGMAGIMQGVGKAQTGKLVVIVEENESYGNIVGNSQAPYLNQLIANGEPFTNYTGVADGSNPNYLAMTSGLTSVKSPPPKNIFQAIDGTGGSLTWKEFMESEPGNCANGNSANIPGTNVALYTADHDPAYSYQGNTTCNANDVPMNSSTFNPANLPSLSYIVPNECDDMHTLPGSGQACPAYYGSNSGTTLIGLGDNWLSKVVPSFDDGDYNQYTLGWVHALQPHNMTGTFFVNTGNLSSNPASMTWAEVTALSNAGNEIGSHTVDHYNIQGCTNQQTCINEVCQDRQNLISHGITPVNFAYPFGAYDANAESIVKNCGFTAARTAGGVDVSSPGGGPVYAETFPPKDPLAIRTVYQAPTGNPSNVPPLQLSDMQAAVNGAATHGGGWIVLTFHQICDQTLDPSNYSSCIADWGPVELSTLNALLDWLQNAGQPGGAPAGTVVKTMAQALNGG